ncbi:Peptidase_C39 like family protein [Marinobacter sp. es.048]|uniref:PA2778 family cysteine peptidase n=1 Tax=Marinobacter sp. es.048 TaxID=1761795 RepID=UPI000B58EA96|nr:PA2778 family cysteine peptidase [Marinobacter sp. es.048]SNC75926.1 Peptidase_C39 like family protein [Marinobacter sp. es.048]
MAVIFSDFKALSCRLTLILLVSLLAGCASAPKWPAPETHQALPDRAMLDNVPFYPQERYQCGPASLAMMLNSQGLSSDPDILKELVYIPGREGSLQVEMIAGARAHGMLVYPLDGELESVLTEIAAGNPVLVMQNLRFGWWPQWHFAVVIGYDAGERDLILHTDTRKREAIDLEVFSNTWGRAENWAVTILPPDRIPATAAPLRFLQSAHDLETTGRTTAAGIAYKTAETTWPGQPTATMARGNLAWQLGHQGEAQEHFLRAVKRFPEFAEGWNNLAFALQGSGCANTATQAARCAAALAPDRFGESQLLDHEGTISAEQCPALPECPREEP